MNPLAENEKQIVTLSKNVIEKFIYDWQKSPFEYSTEIDIQAEIYSRLAEELKLKNTLLFKNKYDSIKLETYKEEQIYRRIACEYPTHYFDEEGKRKYCQPDIIIYRGDIEGVPPDNKDGFNFPMLLVCEIKYETESGGDFDREHRQADVKKLNRLLDQRKEEINGTEYALFLNFIRKNKISDRKWNMSCELGKVSQYDNIIPFSNQKSSAPTIRQPDSVSSGKK